MYALFFLCCEKRQWLLCVTNRKYTEENITRVNCKYGQLVIAFHKLLAFSDKKFSLIFGIIIYTQST